MKTLLRPLLLLLVVALLATACGGDDTADEATAPGDTATDPGDAGTDAPAGDDAATEAAATGGAADAFPVTVADRYGETEIPAPPEAVVGVGVSDVDNLLALGVTPVGFTPWLYSEAPGVGPWATDALGDASPTLLDSTELDFEAVAALGPDLVLGLQSAVTEADHARLEEVAPTVAQPEGFVDFGVPWDEQIRITGEALGRGEDAEAVIADVEQAFADAAEANPEFAGTQAIVMLASADGTFYAYGPEDARARFMAALGFEVPDEIAELAGDQFFAPISAEQLTLLDAADVLVWVTTTEAEREAVERSALYPELEAVQAGASVFVEGDDARALSYGTALAIPYALDAIVPDLAEAVAAADGGATEG